VTQWPISRLGDVAEVAAGGGAPQDAAAFSSAGHPFIRACSLKALVARNDADLEHLEDEVAGKYGLRLFPSGTIVFAKSGMSATKGIVHRLAAPAYLVNHLAALVPNGRIDSRFLRHWLNAHSPTSLIKDPAYPSIRLADIAALRVPAPSLDEQRRIAAILDTVYALRVKRVDAIQALEDLPRAMFFRCFGDPDRNPKKLKVEPLGNYLRFTTSTMTA
jgi:type I restriction enzyme S subunit